MSHSRWVHRAMAASLTVPELKEWLRQRGLPDAGLKKDLIQRMEEAIARCGAAAAATRQRWLPSPGAGETGRRWMSPPWTTARPSKLARVVQRVQQHAAL